MQATRKGTPHIEKYFLTLYLVRQMVMKLPKPYKSESRAMSLLSSHRHQGIQINCSQKKTRQIAGFFAGEINRQINAWSTVDAYALSADPLSYAQPYEHHG